LAFVIALFAFICVSVVGANTYIGNIYFTIPDSVLMAGEKIELKGGLYLANYSDNGTLVSSSAPFSGAVVNITLRNITDNFVYMSNNSFVTDSLGKFYSNSSFYPNSPTINAPSVNNTYVLRAEYTDANGSVWYSQFEIRVVNESMDTLRISSDKATYYASEPMKVELVAVKLIGDRAIYVANVSVEGSIRNSTKDSLQNFSCTTNINGKCLISLTSPSIEGGYFVEADDFKTFSSFSVVPFFFNIYMKDELGQSSKSVYALGEQARIEVSIANTSSSDVYTFSGYITNSSGTSIKVVDSTTLNSNNSFKSSFLFTIDSLTFDYGSYIAYITVSKNGGNSKQSSVSFEVKDWILSMNKKSVQSGFEYGMSTFTNKTVKLEILPSYRLNGTILSNLSYTYFATIIKDKLENTISAANVTWNASCGKEGCYELSITTPTLVGEYVLSTTLSYNGLTQTANSVISVIDGVMSAQSTNSEGSLKELFGTNEYVYISLTAYNSTSSGFNLSDAEVFLVDYMNGSSFSYTQVNNFSLVNSSNTAYEWAWNSTLQRIKLDVPKAGGLYNVFIFGNNRSVGTSTKFIINPYDVCGVPKNTPGSVTSGYYYVWQFKTTDTIYFELKLTQANNPLGKATAANGTNSSVAGKGSACNVDTTTKQVVSNATINVLEVRNVESGAVQTLNTTESICKASDTSGGYTCTVKPLSKWDGGQSVVKFSISGNDGTTDVAYTRFEAKAFYLYGWSSTWQNNPDSNITFNVQLYEAGNNWWSGSGNSGGLSGTLTLKKVEYQGRDGEWIWPPVDYSYNASAVNSSSASGGTGTITIPAAYAPGGVWKTGYYRAIIQGTTTNGDTDYGYVWFGVKLWDVYGQPIECTSTGCNYKSYFNSKENITLYVKISKAGNYNYYDSGGSNIYGRVSVGIKSIQDCRTWPCKELNQSTDYTYNKLSVNASSPWYWNANIQNNSAYVIRINKTSNGGSWGTGYYSVILDINGTDTGYAWFNTIAFYVETQPTNANGSDYIYSIKNRNSMYFNVTSVKAYKYGYWYGGSYSKYNASDYINTTIDSISLRSWNEQTRQAVEYKYPGDLNVTSINVRGNSLVNISYLNGSWPTGYYWGDMILKNSANETSTGSLWFEVKPFRVDSSTTTYSIDEDQCVNSTLYVYEPAWWPSTSMYGNFSVIGVTEDIWSMAGYSQNSYTNYTLTTFNHTANFTICPNASIGWGSGSWGGYHYLKINVKDNLLNNTQTGWLSFRAVPYQVSWGSIFGGTQRGLTDVINISVSLNKSSGATARGRLTQIYQWRSDSSWNGQQNYVFRVGNCYSNVSDFCYVNGTQNVLIYPPTGGWREGYNYLYPAWTKENDGAFVVSDWSGIYFEGRPVYNGWFSNSDSNGYWRYSFNTNENITIKIYTRDSSNNPSNVVVNNVYYSFPGDSCWSEYCKTYTNASVWSLVECGRNTGADGEAVINIQKPGSGWSYGYGYIKADITGASGSAVITGGSVRVMDPTPPNVTISAPAINSTINGRNFSVSLTTTENAECYINFQDYSNYHRSYCSWFGNLTNSTNSSSYASDLINSCNASKYGFNSTNTTYYYEYTSSNYISASSGANYDYWYSSGSTGFVTGGTTNHTYTFNTTNKVTGRNLSAQDYALFAYCYDSDYNYGRGFSAIRINRTQ
jgi:hypothetical protein